MKIFERTPPRVNACQWTAETTGEILTWLGGELGESPDGQPIALSALDARLGDWIVRDEFGGFFALAPAVFEALYVEVVTA